MADALALHFKVFQAGEGCTEGRKDLEVERPGETTIGVVKRRLFPEHYCGHEQQKSIRFIANGKMLCDEQTLEQCRLAQDAFIHVSISEPSVRSLTEDKTGSGGTSSARFGSATDAVGGKGVLVSGSAFFAGSGALLQLGWQRRTLISPGASQLLFILAAVWIYLVLCHGLPVFLQLLNACMRGGIHAETSPAAQNGPSSTAISVSADVLAEGGTALRERRY